jgi:subtilisin family serine protease
MASRNLLLLGTAIPLILLSGCGGGNSGVASTPAPVVAAAPAAAPPPSPAVTATSVNYDTAEYTRSNAAAQAQALGAYQAGATGRGVTVAVIDSGIDQYSAEFNGRISSLSADLAGTRGLQDDSGHGTAVAGVLLAAKNDIGVHGVALGATLLVARTDTPGTCATTTGADPGCSHNDNNIARGVDLAITAGARVINMSLGGSPANANLRAAIGRATSAGIIVVISAGNAGVKDPVLAADPDLLAQVASDPVARGLVLIAGATDSSRTLADFSNKAGSWSAYYLTALGVEVRSNDQTGKAMLYSGTSFSAPVVAGAVALLAQAFPNLTGVQIVDLLLRTATDLGASGTDTVYGHGELNIARAFQPQGQTSLGTTTTAVSLTNNGTLSAAMGDAAKGGMATNIRDGYGRDFTVDLSPTLARAPRSLQLSAALMNGTRHLNAGNGATTLALSVAERTPERLVMSQGDYGNARALAASVATRIGRDTSLALGFATGSDGLDRSLSARTTPAFLVADSGRGLEKAPQGAFAIRHRIGGIGVTLAAETGDLRLWERSDIGPRGDRYRRFGYGALTLGADANVGPLSLGGRLTRMTERETVLGARFLGALGGDGATSWFVDARATLVPANEWRMGAELRRGWTLIPAGAARGNSTLATQALALDVARTSLFTRGDSLALRWSEPLRVTGGGIELSGLDILSLTPNGHERDLEAVYARELGRGWLTINSFWRQQPGNFAAAPDDIGAAVRYSFGF